MATQSSLRPVESSGGALARPKLAWPGAVSARRACAKVSRLLPTAGELRAHRYHHPFLGLVFECPTRAPRNFLTRSEPGAGLPLRAHIVVDLVGGRAHVTDPWDTSQLVPIDRENGPGTPADPQPVLNLDEALAAGRSILAGVLARRRRLDDVLATRLFREPIVVGKPNWWVTGRRGSRPVEVIVDAISGRHYACSA